MPRNWDTVDRISNAIVDLLNAEKKEPGCSAVDLFAGQLLALLAMGRMAPPPEPFLQVLQAAGNCLVSLKLMDEAGE
jgi:hypothetical protein